MASSDRVRLDKWLWAARFYKTRSQAAAAIKAGKISVGEVRAKASHQVAVGENITLRKGPFEWALTVTALADKRGSAEVASSLFAESAESLQKREQTRAQLSVDRAAAPRGWGRGRPTKKHRREFEQFRRHYRDRDKGGD